MKKFLSVLLFLIPFLPGWAQSGNTPLLQLRTESGEPLAGTTVELLRPADSSLIKVAVTDAAGNLRLPLSSGALLRISRVGYATRYHLLQEGKPELTVQLQPATASLSGVTITARRPLVQLAPGKTIVNVEAGITNAGTTVLEALEKMPGVTVDKDGNLSLKGRNGIQVMIDGRPTYLTGAELNSLLGGMSASAISQVELIDQPSARYDAAGKGGIINIRTKKTNQRGLYGSVSTAYGQGIYPKSNNSLQLNYRSGAWNLSLNYAFNYNRNFSRIDALRTYYAADETTVLSRFYQSSYFAGRSENHTVRVGVDYTVSLKTAIGLMITGVDIQRRGSADNPVQWTNAGGGIDSLLLTSTRNRTGWKNGGLNLNLRHTPSAGRELSIDLDLLDYRINTTQEVENRLRFPGTYLEANRAAVPNAIRIYSGRADYAVEKGSWKVETGLKTVRTTTDNLSDFELLDTTWKPDYGRSNHFLYNELIQAAYGSAQLKKGALTVQGGLRYEFTHFDARQLGNPVVKDSSFSRSYHSLFPTMMLTLAVDSNHSFSLSAGRRIDRPPFQQLNPFLSIINKYTYQRGNPFYRPQYTWNIELSHRYKEVLLTGLAYSRTTDFFSQVFPVDTSGIVIYTVGNLGKLQVLSLSVGTQLSPAPWWSLSAQAVLNHRIMEGVVARAYSVSVTQLNINLNNQFRFKKGWSAELTGFYSSRGRNDIQEIVDPAGQLSIGVARQVLQNKGTLRLAVRDIFYTQWMKGFTYFQQATEWFKLTRDTRVATLSFSYRFGKAFKATRRNSGAREEMERVGNG
jgi:iron complex outermembrane receptor protein